MKKAIWAGLASVSLAACSGGETAEPAGEVETDAVTTTEESPVEAEDALVDGTEYNATTIMDCSFDGVAAAEGCEAGIVRNWGEDGMHLIEVQKPDGFTRALFFEGTTPTGADSAEADGSSGWDFAYTVDGDRITIEYGPETYVVVEAMITGG